jgi:multidrug resistance efflux pump
LIAPALVIVLPPLAPAFAEEPGEAKRGGASVKDLEEAVALAERQVLIKEAEVKVAEAQINIAKARLKLFSAKCVAARVAQEYAATKLRRLMELRKAAAVAEETILEAEASLKSAEGARRECDENLAVGEAQVEFEVARRDVARAQLEESALRMNQLRDRLKASK